MQLFLVFNPKVFSFLNLSLTILVDDEIIFPNSSISENFLKMLKSGLIDLKCLQDRIVLGSLYIFIYIIYIIYYIYYICYICIYIYIYIYISLGLYLYSECLTLRETMFSSFQHTVILLNQHSSR